MSLNLVNRGFIKEFMKKLLVAIGLLVLFPLSSKAFLMGFMDGSGLWDETGKQLYTCFQDGTCVGLDNKIYNKSDLVEGNFTPVVQISSPVSPTPTPTPSPVFAGGVQPTPTLVPTLLPPYSEDNLAHKLGNWRNQDIAGLIKTYFLGFNCVANSSTTARCDGSGNGSNQITFKFNNQIVGDCSKDWCGANPDNFVSISGLTASSTYNYQIIYSEAGRQDSVFTKSFTTPGN